MEPRAACVIPHEAELRSKGVHMFTPLCIVRDHIYKGYGTLSRPISRGLEIFKGFYDFKAFVMCREREWVAVLPHPSCGVCGRTSLSHEGN
ncbi:hypothetical protein E2C01_062432 [Portunus trituberculatus]|uniref:Uncharacterized protein n=1 Tax=Portunus trituberculatus TaxID=210409 RepID=A0A5B7HI08_PORTR|nr:hypothetical protein [Portunus trituberculatus]